MLMFSPFSEFILLIRSYTNDGVVPSSHLLHTIHYVPMPHLRYSVFRSRHMSCLTAHTSMCIFGGLIWVCYSNPVHWCTLSRHADYTNNPMMYTRLWLLQHLGDQLAGASHVLTFNAHLSPSIRRQLQHNGTTHAPMVAIPKFYNRSW